MGVAIALAGVASATDTGVASDDMAFGGISSCSGDDCHTEASNEIVVAIEGPLALEHGEIGSYVISFFEDGEIPTTSCFEVPGVFCGAGLHVAAFLDDAQTPTGLAEGILASSDDGTQITTDPPFVDADGQLTHFKKNFVFSYGFTVEAPDFDSTLTLTGAMNAFVLVGGQEAARWKAADDFVITVPEPTGPLVQASVLGTLGLLAMRSARRRKRIRS